VFDAYTGVTNAPLTYSNSETLSDAEFEQLALELTESARRDKAEDGSPRTRTPSPATSRSRS
jgi:hypothetical protein